MPVNKWFDSDLRFNQLYPAEILSLAARHWTPLSVTRKAAPFLTSHPGAKILDIGSGVGKFCLFAAHLMPYAHFYGVEQRTDSIAHAENAKKILQLKNVTFIQGNFTELKLTDYDHFYFYNSFYENIADTENKATDIDYSLELYNYYTRSLYKQLESLPPATRLATFHSTENEIPPTFHVVQSGMDELLKCWMKE